LLVSLTGCASDPIPVTSWEVAVLPFDFSASDLAPTRIDRDLQFDIVSALGKLHVPARPADGPVTRGSANLLYLTGAMRPSRPDRIQVQMSHELRGDPVWTTEYPLNSPGSAADVRSFLLERISRDVSRIARRLQRELP